MNICLWSGASFEEWYSSYHLMHRLIREMINAGHNVSLVQVQKSDGRLPDDLKDEPRLKVYNVIQKPAAKSNFVFRYIKGFQYYSESGKVVKSLSDIDVIFLQSNNNAYIPVKIANKLHIPVVYNVQDVFPLDAMVIGKLSKSNPAFIIAKSLQSKAYKKATRVVTISEDLKKTIQNEGRKDVDVIYNWSYQNEAYDIPDEKNHFLNSNSIQRKDGFRVVYAGNVGQMVDAEMLVQTAKKLGSYKDIVFYVVGEGSGLNRLKARTEELGLKNVRFYGRQPMEYAQDNYCAADVNINPVPKGVIYTCMPSKTATCLLSEKPTVVSMDLDSDMARRLSTVDQWSVVAPGDSDAMAEEILKVYKNDSRKSNNAVKFLVELGPVENAKLYVKILEDAVKGK